MKHPNIVIAALSVAIALPAVAQQQPRNAGTAAAAAPPPAPTSSGEWAASSAFIYPSRAYWSDPKAIEGFLGSYQFMKDIEPEISTEEQVVFKEVIAFLEQGQKAEARQSLLTLLTADPQASAAVDFNIGNLLVDEGMVEESLPYYRQAIEKHQNFFRAHHRLGIVLSQLGRFEDAIPHLTKSANLGVADGVTYGLLGLAYLNTGKLLAAESAYRNATIFEPDQSDWHVGLAQVLLEQQKWPESIAILDQLIAEDPAGEDLWLTQSNAYLALEDYNKAAGNYEIVRRMGKGTVESLLLLGDIYNNENLKDMALNAYLEAIELGGEAAASVDRLVQAARILVGRNNISQAERLLTAIESNFGENLTPDERLLVLKLRSQIAIANNDSEAAAEILLQIVDATPFDGEALMLLGQHFRTTQEISKAEIYYERAAKVSGFEYNARLAHAQMLVNMGRYRDALPLLEEAYDRQPSDALQRYITQIRGILQRSSAF